MSEYDDGRLDPYNRLREQLRQEDAVLSEIVAAYSACHAWSGDEASQRRQYASIAVATLQRLGWGPTRGRCGALAPTLAGGTALPLCELPADHGGWHKAVNGCEWTDSRFVPPVAPREQTP